MWLYVHVHVLVVQVHGSSLFLCTHTRLSLRLCTSLSLCLHVGGRHHFPPSLSFKHSPHLPLFLTCRRCTTAGLRHGTCVYRPCVRGRRCSTRRIPALRRANSRQDTTPLFGGSMLCINRLLPPELHVFPSEQITPTGINPRVSPTIRTHESSDTRRTLHATLYTPFLATLYTPVRYSPHNTCYALHTSSC